MKRVAAIAVIGLLLLASTAWSSQVTNVEVACQDGQTVARIYVDGPIRYTHLTEVPKDGRPDRLIVDVITATHELGAKKFMRLPSCIISGIRSSQYAVTPEKIVRVVFDLKNASVYKMTNDENAIQISFGQKEAKQFATWSTADVVAALRAEKKAQLASADQAAAAPKSSAPAPKKVSAAQQNQGIENDRLASLSGTTKAAPQPKKAAEVVAPKSADKPIDRSFSARNFSEGADQPAAPKVKAQPKAAKAPAPVKTQPKAKAKPAPSPVPASVTKANLAQAPAPAKADKPKVKNSETKSKGQPAPVQKVKKETPAKKATPVVAKKDSPAKPAADTKERATARFRRKAPSAKIRGTMVAEFPKRLVIKYKTSGRRDPFGSLVDREQTYNNPIGARTPNVEGLKLVGIIDAEGGTNRALFEDKSGYSYILKTGDKVRNGYVLRVESDQVYFQIFEYGWSRTVALSME